MVDENDLEPGGRRPRDMSVADFNEFKRRAEKKTETSEIDKRPKSTREYEALIDAIENRLGISLSLNSFSGRMFIEGLGDQFDGILNETSVLQLQHRLIMACVRKPPSSNRLREMCERIAAERSFNPLKDKLVRLSHYGLTSCQHIASTYFGAEPTVLNNTMLTLWMTAAVRRVMQPGCKFDHMLVLQGGTGAGKSSACRILAMNDEWFSDYFPPPDDERKCIEAFRGKWIVEHAELAGLKTADQEKLKAMLSRQIDMARPAYGRDVIEAPRQCVFVGTTEEDEFLVDNTNRRFWPIKCGAIDLEGLRLDAEQLWAEIKVIEQSGISLEMPEELWPQEREIQRDARKISPFVEEIIRLIGNPEEGKFPSVNLREWFQMSAQAWVTCQFHYGKAMRDLGWKRKRVRLTKTQLEWFYVKNSDKCKQDRDLPDINKILD